jgi:hypothetical protein
VRDVPVQGGEGDDDLEAMLAEDDSDEGETQPDDAEGTIGSEIIAEHVFEAATGGRFYSAQSMLVLAIMAGRCDVLSLMLQKGCSIFLDEKAAPIKPSAGVASTDPALDDLDLGQAFNSHPAEYAVATYDKDDGGISQAILTALLAEPAEGMQARGEWPNDGATRRPFGEDNTTLLHVAAANGSVGALSLLLHTPTVREGTLGLDALNGVSTGDGKKAVTYLIADVNQIDAMGQSALHVSCLKGNAEAVSFLMDHGAQPNLQDLDGDACVHMASSSDVLAVLFDEQVRPKWALCIACVHLYLSDLTAASCVHRAGGCNPNGWLRSTPS